MTLRRRSGLVGPLILIAVGVILLLNNLGVISWEIWDLLWRLWPLILIGIGLEILLGRRASWGALLAVVLVFLIAAGVFFVRWLTTGADWLTGESTLREQNVVWEMDGAERAEIRLEAGVGRLDVDALEDSPDLLHAQIEVPDRAGLEEEFSIRDGLARGTLRVRHTFRFFGFGFRGGDWKVYLSPRIPLQLRLDAGVGESYLDLSELQVERLDLNMGVGDVTVVMPAEGQVRATVDGGVGDLRIIIPRGMAARIRVNRGVGNLSVDDRFSRDGDVYISEGYGTSDNWVDLDLDIGIGDVTVEGS